MDWLPLDSTAAIWDWLLAQTPTPPQPGAAPSPIPPSTDIDLLKAQLEFLKDANSRLNQSFTQFVEAMKYFLLFLAVIGGLLTWIFHKNLEDAKRVAREMVRQELLNHLTPLVESEADNLKRTLRTEQIIGETVIDYYLPAADTEPPEYKLLKERGFFKVRFWHEHNQPKQRLGSVLVLDFVNSPLVNFADLEDPDPVKRQAAARKRDQLVDQKVQEIIALGLGRPIFVIYVRPGRERLAAIDNLTTNHPEIKYYSSANAPIPLMGTVVDAAYVAYGERKLRQL